MITAALMAGSVFIGMFIALRFVSGLGTYVLLASIAVCMSRVADLVGFEIHVLTPAEFHGRMTKSVLGCFPT